MNFFESQEKARKSTAKLVFLFILGIALIILAIDLAVVFAFVYIKPTFYGPMPTQDLVYLQHDPWRLFLLVGMYISPIIILIVLMGTVVKMIALRQGGISVAEMVGARELSHDTHDFHEKRFINIVEEMSIASGVKIPKLYVMDKEMGINAFVSGLKPEDTVMVVTKGALDQLSRDELQGVIGHEFSHIFNGDMQISLKLMGLLGGLLFIGQAGYVMLRILSYSDRRSSSSSKGSGGQAVIFLLVVAVILLVLGYIGLFFGRLIKAAVSRQREKLADACSVQYTRNPRSLVFAFKRIMSAEKGSNLESKNVEDISHLCFSTPRWMMFSNLLATHPTLDERIKLIDPKGEYVNIPLPDVNQSTPPPPSPKKQADMQTGLMAITAILAANAKVSVNAIKQSVGNPTEATRVMAQQLIQTIPQEVLDDAHDPNQVAHIYYALFLSKEETRRKEQLLVLSEKLEANVISKIERLNIALQSLPRASYLPLIDITMPTFTALAGHVRQTIYDNLVALANLCKTNISKFAVLAMIAKTLEAKPSEVKYQDFTPVLEDMSKLIWSLILQGGHPAETQGALFNKIMLKFTQKTMPIPTVSGNTPIAFHVILTKLNHLAPKCKDTLIDALLACIADDGMITANEAELIRAIAASLNCPIPPVVAH